MKYSTSPPTSRCHSPVPTEFSSSLPMPIVYRHNCMGAATKCYKYLRKLLKFEQMDFEFAVWQMIFLFVAPQKVYRNFQNRKQTKLQFARDDPAFLVLVTCCLCISTIGFAIVLSLGFFQFVKLLLYMVFIDYIAAGLLIATISWFISNRYLRIDKTQDVEWGYAFDIHLNAVFPPLIILHILQLFLYNGTHTLRPIIEYTVVYDLTCFLRSFDQRRYVLGAISRELLLVYSHQLLHLHYVSRLRKYRNPSQNASDIVHSTRNAVDIHHHVMRRY